jgi:hypothetical protein
VYRISASTLSETAELGFAGSDACMGEKKEKPAAALKR